MNPFAGKSPSERNKMIAAIVLGVMSLFALYMAFGRGLFSSSTVKVTASASPTPKSGATPAKNSGDFAMPSKAQQETWDSTTPIVYHPETYGAPDAGRNIFAFYEPPPPCTTCTPTPTPIKISTPSPTPPPPIPVSDVSPQSVYAGTGAFRLEVNGDKFDPSFHIYFQQSEMPTQFVSPQKLVANIPAALIASEGPAQVIVQSPDGKLYSKAAILTVQAPPKPNFAYVGMIGRKRYNNDTAVFREADNKPEFAARLNDVVGGRFRLISISANEAVFEDVNLGFKHRLPLFRPAPGTTAAAGPGGQPLRRGYPGPGGGYQPYNNPNMQNPQMQQQEIPGIPNNIPRYVQPQPGQQPGAQPQPQPKKDEDDDGDGDN